MNERMTMAPSELVGREEGLALCARAFERAQRGMGGLVVIRGEAGIGKTRLVEAAADVAMEAGFSVVWGRAIEAGSAPAFWPFSEVLRGLLWKDAELARGLSERRRLALSTLSPELLHPDLSPVSGLHALPSQHARFLLLEAFASLLSQAASHKPLLVVFEDMHAADLDSLQGLEPLASQVRSARIVLLVTSRPVASAESQVADALDRLARVSNTLTLAPLAREEIRAVAETTLGRALDPTWIDALSRTSEGNPLFVVELCRLWNSKRDLELSIAPTNLPASVRATMRSRLDALSAVTARVMCSAAVHGREVEVAMLRAMGGIDATTLDASLEEAIDARILEAVGEGVVRFTHVLLRDVAYASLTQTEREALHLVIADQLSNMAGGRLAWAELAHHLLASGTATRERGIEAARCAADQAFERFAFDEAAHWASRALQAHAPFERAEPLRHADLRLLRARALIAAGHVTEGRALCLATFEQAKSLGLSELAGRAVLEYGRAFVVAVVDKTLIGLSEEALKLLPPSEKSLRARLQARRAAAMQPAADPHEPIALARAAVQEARELAEPNVLLETLRSATSAMADLDDPRLRRPYNEEMVALARSLDMPFDELKGLQRLTFDCFESGDIATADATLARLSSLAERLAIPQGRWIAFGLMAMARAREGAFAEANALSEAARAEGKRARDATAERAVLLQRICQLRVLGRGAEALQLLEQEFELLSQISVASPWHVALRTYLRGLTTTAQPMDEQLVHDACRLGDPSVLVFNAEHALRARDRAAARALTPALQRRIGQYPSWGLLGLTMEPPIDRALAHVLWAQERYDEAVTCMESALAMCEETGARPHQALVMVELAELLRERRRASDVVRIVSLEEHSRRLLNEFGMQPTPGLAKTALAVDAASASSAALVRSSIPRLDRQGERWLVTWQGEALSLEDTKGMRFLARLIAEPGRRYHVFELLEVDATQVDLAHAGELLDDAAIEAYRQRVHTLRAQADEHEAQGAEQATMAARLELEAIEDELSRALGLGGRKRRAGSAVEKARINVQRRIRDALRRIARTSPSLARYLDKATKTGTTCVFDP
jgi:hypothetical protein